MMSNHLHSQNKNVFHFQPTNNEDNYYNAKVKITKQGAAELQKFLESGDSWRNGAMDDALGQLLVDVKALDYEVWKWRFEDSFGVDIDTVFKVSTGSVFVHLSFFSLSNCEKCTCCVVFIPIIPMYDQVVKIKRVPPPSFSLSINSRPRFSKRTYCLVNNGKIPDG